ncbi:MAG: EAL domain-containing protein [Chromatiaceae bacterium]|nr:MAG: EAL domain-containing protein [Chromatiaceae bacterium]
MIALGEDRHLRLTLKARALYLGVCLVLAVVIAWDLTTSREQDMEAARQRTHATSVLVSEWLYAAFETSGALLSSMAGEIRPESLARPEEDPEAHARINQWLDRHLHLLPNTKGIALFDSEGRMTHTSGPHHEIGHDISDQGHFQALRDNPDLERQVSRAFFSHETGGFLVAHAQALRDAEGHFAGLLGVRLDLDFFDHWLERTEPTPSSSLTILDHEGRLLARRPRDTVPNFEALLGQPVEASELEPLMRNADDNVQFAIVSPVDGMHRLYTARMVRDLPFLVVAGEAQQAIMTAWWRKFWTLSLAWLVIAGLGLLVLRGYLRTIRYDLELQRSHRSLEEANRTLGQEIRDRQKAEDEIKTLAFFDPLTQLPNRRLFTERLEATVHVCRQEYRHGALLFIDLDNFKLLNDTLGHDQGDQLLMQAARRISGCVHEADTVARLGGDEFVVMLCGLSHETQEAIQQAEIVADKILASLKHPYLLGGQEHHSTASVGVTLFHQEPVSVDELMKRADLAMYQAKAAGRNTQRLFNPDMQALVIARAALEGDLRRALSEKQFLLHYQALVDDDGVLTGAEALLRWQHPDRGLVPPGEFIPLAEDTGLILPIGQWVLEAACAQLAEWARDPSLKNLKLAANVSARQFRHPEFVPGVLRALNTTGADPHRLKLEITESLLLEDVEDVISKMRQLRARGISFALDDFGTGYSSLSYLKRLPLDDVKIDQSFVRDVLIDPNDAAIARTIVALAGTLGLRVIAEGVETREHWEWLSRHGCHTHQGYYFGRPGSVVAMLESLPGRPLPMRRRAHPRETS